MPDKEAKKAQPQIWLFTQTEDGHLVPVPPEAAELVPQIVSPPSPWWENTKEYLALALWREWFARAESPWLEGSCFFCKGRKTADEAVGHAPGCLLKISGSNFLLRHSLQATSATSTIAAKSLLGPLCARATAPRGILHR
jgi:hypothetical protein